jgi:hypothetical protein
LYYHLFEYTIWTHSGTFDMTVNGYRFYQNDEKTRSFASLLIHNDDAIRRVNQLVDIVDTVMKQYSQPIYYQVTTLSQRHDRSICRREWCA